MTDQRPNTPIIETPQERHDRVVAELTAVIAKLPARCASEELAIIGESFLVRLAYIAVKVGGQAEVLDVMCHRAKMRLGAIAIREAALPKPKGSA